MHFHLKVHKILKFVVTPKVPYGYILSYIFVFIVGTADYDLEQLILHEWRPGIWWPCQVIGTTPNKLLLSFTDSEDYV